MPAPGAAAWIEAWSATVGFPRRSALFVDRALCEPGRPAGEWPGASAAQALAAAAGAAWAQRGEGAAVAVLAPGATQDAEVVAAARLAARLRLGELLVLSAGGDGELGVLAALGWRRADAAGPAQPGRPPTCAAVACERCAGEGSPHPRREWHPVHLAALRGWPSDAAAASPRAAAAGWLRSLAAREPNLWLPHEDPAWSALPAGQATLTAMSQLAAEGRRVVWMVPGGVDVRSWYGALADIGRRGLAIKILIDVADAPPRGWWPGLPGWWVWSPADVGELGAVLRATLDSEEPALVELPGSSRLPRRALDEDVEPGSGRWLRPSSAATIVCAADGARLACTAADALAAGGFACGVLHCTALAPLPEPELRAAVARGPLVVADPADGGLGDLVRRLCGPAVAVVRSADDVGGVADLAQSVRARLAANG